MRSSTSDFFRVLPRSRKMTLGQAISFIKEDEMVEITPLSVRMRKSILSGNARRKFRTEQSRAAM